MVEKCTTQQAVNVVVFVFSFSLIYAWIKMPEENLIIRLWA